MAISPLCETYYDAEHKIWFGPKKKDYYGDQMTLGEAIVEVLKLNPSKIIQISDTTKQQLTCEELLKNSIKLCKQFGQIGLKIGDVVSLYSSNSHYLSSIIIASWLSGAVISAVNEKFDKVELGITKPKLIFCDIENFTKAQDVNENLNLNAKIIVINNDFPNVLSIKKLLEKDAEDIFDNVEFPCSKVDGDHTAAIICSSGTTGTPKGVMLSHKSLLNQNIFQTLQLNSVAFTFSFMNWISGLWTFKESILRGCLRIITDRAFTPDYFMEIVERYQVTHILAGTHHMTQISLQAKPEWRTKLKSIDTILCGGTKVPAMVNEGVNDLLGDNKQRPGMVVTYGLTELSSLLSHNYLLLGKGLQGSEGKLLPNTQVRVMNKYETAFTANELGEIQIKLNYKWLGYYNNPQAHAKVYKNNWFSTGDLGYFNEQGFLHICGRVSDVFESNNVQIYPEKIEEVIFQIRGVQEVCVFGIPDLINTNNVACAIVRATNEEGQQLNEEVVCSKVAKKLAELYHLKGGVYFLDSLPRTSSLKIQRNKVRDIIVGVNNKVGG